MFSLLIGMCEGFKELSAAQIFLLSVLNDGLPWVLQAGGIALVMLALTQGLLQWLDPWEGLWRAVSE